MTTFAARARIRLGILATVVAVGVSGCGFSPYKLPLPGGADLGDHPYTVKVEFRDALDLVPQSGVRVDDVSVGKVTDIQLKGWHAVVTMQINGNTRLPDDAEATIRQTSLLGEKFVSIATPEDGGTGRLSNGDVIPLERSGRNPELEEILSAAALLFNGGGLEKTNTIVRELNKTLEGNEPEIKDAAEELRERSSPCSTTTSRRSWPRWRRSTASPSPPPTSGSRSRRPWTTSRRRSRSSTSSATTS